MSNWKICTKYDGTSVSSDQNPQHCALCTMTNAITGVERNMLIHGVFS